MGVIINKDKIIHDEKIRKKDTMCGNYMIGTRDVTIFLEWHAWDYKQGNIYHVRRLCKQGDDTWSEYDDKCITQDEWDDKHNELCWDCASRNYD